MNTAINWILELCISGNLQVATFGLCWFV